MSRTSKGIKQTGEMFNSYPNAHPTSSLSIMRLSQLAFLVMPLATLVVGGTVSRNAEGLGGPTKRQVCPCASQNNVCDVTLPDLCCSGVCASAANSILLNAGTCSVSCGLNTTSYETQCDMYSVIQQALHALRTTTAAVVAALAPMVVLSCVCNS
ncbi:hypothetical protein BKA82DRAFT_3539600 [Pisolithus tinctorius]|nr:hypothetical protein BKA82DRAFT_3539600 [Pisolithus tinctorius]